ncbi:fibrinogen-like protein 1-like protein [Carcharodon carcharias]|uniref:fibrinogen-like protein 1-like protein n=1 Tax=Carcharodon carcharias TaxID=13397 RepID=UPI001B7F297B|nr:fibrinogen-like protein 1-like protein [Carcharodon carcharias]
MATKLGCALTAIIFLALGVAKCEEEIANMHMLDNEERFTRALTLRPASGYPEDCSGVSGKSGLHIIKPNGSPPLVVYCDMRTDGGGWTMIQRNNRVTEINWAEYWTAYKYGFGNILRDHWLGNEYIYKIIKQRNYKIKFLLRDRYNRLRIANYDSFAIGNEVSGYRLSLGRYSGNAGNAMVGNQNTVVHDNMKFSTLDRDQDRSSSNCAKSCRGGFWFNNCYRVNLNVKTSIYWYGLCNGNCKSSQILIKPDNVCKQYN